jgi:hypothetical protein
LSALSSPLKRSRLFFRASRRKTRPAATHPQICKAITPFQPSGSSIGEVLREFANTSSRVATDVRTFRWKTDCSQVLLRIASSDNLEPHNILVQYEVGISSWQDSTSRSVSVNSWSLLMTTLPQSSRRIRSLLLHHGHKPLTSTGPYRFLSLSNRGPSRRCDGTGFVIHSSLMTSQAKVELSTFTITSLER